MPDYFEKITKNELKRFILTVIKPELSKIEEKLFALEKRISAIDGRENKQNKEDLFS